MMNNGIKIHKKEKGITLIALVITIIVLLILAGVSIAMLTGDNGILTQATEAKEENIKGKEKEQIKLAMQSLRIQKEKENLSLTVTPEELQKQLEDDGAKNVTVEAGEKDTLIVNYQESKNSYRVEQNGNIEENGEDGNESTDSNQEVEGVTFSTEYGKIDVIWLDTNNNVIEKPNVPQLRANGESLTPIKWDASNNIVETAENDASWYNYDENRWANAKTKNESYFVWLPRYAYRITYYSDENYKNVTGYYDGKGQWSAETGEIRVAIDNGIETVDYNGEKYIVHPAFETNLDNGGWDKDLSGIWVAKFEANGTGENVKFTYGVQSTSTPTIGEQYTTARKATYGYTGQQGEDGNTSFMNSHMIKNSEWGAVAYLTHSKYGINGKEITINNNSEYYTGGGIGEAYKANVNQSSTGNVYGIYDLSGCAWEYVAGFNSVDANGNFEKYGWTEATGLTSESSSTKYATKYYNTTNLAIGNNIIYTYGKIGDATKEVCTGGKDIKNASNDYGNWYSDFSNITNSNSPLSGRGGNSGTAIYAGLFCSSGSFGYSKNYNSFRAVLAE